MAVRLPDGVANRSKHAGLDAGKLDLLVTGGGEEERMGTGLLMLNTIGKR